MSKGRLAGLDALRGIAALCVLLFHARPGWLPNGYLSVDLFFMLSGYVMARSFEPRLAAGMSPSQFLRERYRRLWPVMAVGAIIALPLFFVDYGLGFWPVALANLMLIPVPMRGVSFLLNSPAWSIFFELVANATHAVLLWRLPRVRVALIAATSLIILALVAAFSQKTLEIGMRPEAFLAGIPRVMLSYCLGILMWRSWRDQPPFRLPGWIVLLALPAYFVASGLQGGSRWGGDLLFVVVAGPAMIAGGLAMSRIPSWLGWLGAISFPIYAVHLPVVSLAERFNMPLAIQIALALAIAAAVNQAEAPLRRRLRAAFSRKQALASGNAA